MGHGVDMLDPHEEARRDRRRDEVMEKFGVAPRAGRGRAVACRAIRVDNVPGAPGIGLKTAALLINEYGDLDTLLARADEIKQPKRRETLIDNADQIRLSRKLVQLDCDMPLDVTLDELEVQAPTPTRSWPSSTAMEFRTMTRRVADKLRVAAPAMPETRATAAAGEPTTRAATTRRSPIDTAAYECVRDAGQLSSAGSPSIRDVGYVAVDTETTSLDEMRADLVGISLCVDAGQGLPTSPSATAPADGDLFGSTAPGRRPDALIDQALAPLKPLLEDAAVLKIGQNMKYDAKIFARHGIRVAPIDDTMLMSYAMHAGLHGHGMDELSERYLGHQPHPDQGPHRLGQGADHLRPASPSTTP